MNLIDILQEQVGLSRSEVLNRVASAPKRYKVYQIPKRSGGTRTIAQPARDVKLLQRALVDTVLSKLPVHHSATAYHPGSGIKKNANLHASSRVILKMDFKDFFPSIKVGDWSKYFRAIDENFAAQIGLKSAEDLYISTKILFWGVGSSQPKCLSIGAPSSPIISNILMYRFDAELELQASRHGVVYSRYADDITLSGDRAEDLLLVEAAIVRHLRRVRSPALALNHEKRGLYTSAKKRMVTGLIITPENKVSLGRKRKRIILSLVHQYKLDLLTPDSIAHIQGLVAFARDVEPAFYETLVRKYGAGTLSSLAKYRILKRVQPRDEPPNQGN